MVSVYQLAKLKACPDEIRRICSYPRVTLAIVAAACLAQALIYFYNCHAIALQVSAAEGGTTPDVPRSHTSMGRSRSPDIHHDANARLGVTSMQHAAQWIAIAHAYVSLIARLTHTAMNSAPFTTLWISGLVPSFS
jgi:hypothetical protein